MVQGAGDIAKLGKDWDDLFTRALEAHAFLSRAWAETFISEKRIKGAPLLIVIWAGPKLVALLPLSIRSFCGIRVAEPIGTMVPSYLGLLADLNYTGVIQAVADVWLRERLAHVFYNKYLSSLDEVTNKLAAELAHRGFVYKRGFSRTCRWIRLGCSFDEYLKKTKSSKRRRELKRKKRKVLELGSVDFEAYVGDQITPEIITRMADIQEKSWMKRRGAADLNQPFFRKLVIEMSRAGFARAWIIRINGSDVVFGLGYVAHRQFYYLRTAFKLSCGSSLSVGSLLTSWLVQDACDSGILSFDFGLGDAEYKQFWATDDHDVVMAIAGRGFLGYLAVYYYSATWWLAKQKWLFALYLRFKKWYKIRQQGR